MKVGFEVFAISRVRGRDGWWEVNRSLQGLFQRLEEALAEAGRLALLGKVVEIYAVRDTAFKGEERRLFAVLSWWAFEKGATSVAYDTDLLD